MAFEDDRRDPPFTKLKLERSFKGIEF